MVFASQTFLFVFLPAVLLLYYTVFARARTELLLVASYLFYGWGEPGFALALLFSTCFDFFIARAMQGKEARVRKLLLAASVTGNVGLLAYFKYAGFLVNSLREFMEALGFSPGWAPAAVLLPAGISFFTFQKLSYTIDVYRGIVPAQQRFRLFALYVASFPQLIAGPIVRYREVQDQLARRSHTLDKFFDGSVRFCLGLGKKVLIANVLGRTTDTILALPPSQLTCSTAWLAMLAYAFQIYFDFSGYSDMAIGLGKMLGFVFPENFNQPYISRSVTEFWRRWHISLSTWFRDYLYIPLGGNRMSTARTYVNLWAVFLLCGLWHGAEWTFVIWGCYHGMLLTLERIFLRRRLDKLPGLLAVPVTFVLIVIGWVFFRADSLGQALALLKVMFSPFGATTAAHESLRGIINAKVLATLAAAGLISFHAPLVDAIPSAWRARLAASQGAVWLKAGAALALFVLAWAALAAGTFNPFIYYRF